MLGLNGGLLYFCIEESADYIRTLLGFMIKCQLYLKPLLRNFLSFNSTLLHVHVIVPQKGDRVYSMAVASGGYAEYCTSASTGTRLLHSNLTFEEGAGVGIPYYTAYRALVIMSVLFSSYHVSSIFFHVKKSL